MIKAIQALLSGVFFTFILDFFLFLGLKLHYTDHYRMGIYYNTLFADNQNIFLFALFTLLIGYMSIYVRSLAVSLSTLVILFSVTATVLIPSIGFKTGEWMFQKSNQTIVIPPHTYQGSILYIDRKVVFFYDTDLKKMITLPKEQFK